MRSRSLFVAVCLAAAAVGSAQTPSDELRESIERYSADLGSLNRRYDLETSSVRRARFGQFYGEALKELEARDFPALDQNGKVDWILFANELRYRLKQLEIDASRMAETADLLPFHAAVEQLHESRRNLDKPDPRAAAETLVEVERIIRETRKRYEAEDRLAVKTTVANRAAGISADLGRTLKQWYDFHAGYDPIFTWWVRDPYEKASEALKEYSEFLRKELAGADNPDVIIGDPIGRGALLADLAYEMIPYSPEELIEIANKEFEWCDREMLRASREMGFGDDWHAAMEKVKTLHVGPGEQPEMIRGLAEEAIDFVEEFGLVTVPPLAKETWRMSMMSPERQKVNPFFLGGEVIQVSFPTDAMSHEDKLMSMRGNNRHFSRATVHHELIPGHHLQQFMTSRYRPYREVFSTPFWTEGWSLWWEMLLWERGLPKTAEDRVGFLFWRMHRCARIIFSLSFHLERMSPQEAIDFLVERVGHERANAEAEVRRSFTGAYSPLYQCAYMLGALQFRALHSELVDSGRMTSREFHDRILRLGRIPVEMVRATLTGQRLESGFQPSWRFYK